MSSKEVGISLPRDLLDENDARRADVPGSRYIHRSLEFAINRKGAEAPSGSAPQPSGDPPAFQPGDHP